MILPGAETDGMYAIKQHEDELKTKNGSVEECTKKEAVSFPNRCVILGRHLTNVSLRAYLGMGDVLWWVTACHNYFITFVNVSCNLKGKLILLKETQQFWEFKVIKMNLSWLQTKHSGICLKQCSSKEKWVSLQRNQTEQRLLKIDLGKDFSPDHTLLFHGCKQRAGFSTDEEMMLSELEIYPNLRQEHGRQRLFSTSARQNVQWNITDSKVKLEIWIIRSNWSSTFEIPVFFWVFFAIDL